MPESRKCPRCEAVLPRNVPDGYCMACFLEIGLDPPADPQNPEVAADEELLPSDRPFPDKMGDRIGRYKLLQQIGEGGCGVVYMAEQEAPVRRKVALKVIKLGMDTGQVIARFEAERQALAMMDHPNIAKVLDAGATDAGRPFFVMELVQGEPITAYCDHRHFSTRQRLELFIDLCHAVQHAHQKGIIHRDIKPSNILVTEVDARPLPKIIDFGIAKATSNQPLTDKTYFTAYEQFIGTPAYMSPEQAGLGRLDVDSRSDIYSLGMLLYELLTAHPAFDPAELRRSAIDEVLRTIREEEPIRPSVRLTSLSPAQVTTIAHCRQTEAGKLSHLLRGDLDWIAMKALEKDRSRRYETADALAMDIQRHLNHEPVLARPPDPLYRLQKLVRKHRIAVAAGAAIALTLLLGIFTSLWQAIRATRAEHEQARLRQEAVAAEKTARIEAGKGREVAEFLKEMLNGVGPEVARGRDAELLRGILQKTAARIDHDLKGEPQVEVELRSTLGTVYEDLGDYPKAEVMHRAALAILRANPSIENKDLAATLNNLADTLDREGRYPEAEAMHRETLARRRKLLGNEHLDVAVSLNGLGTALWNQGKLTEAEPCYREAFAISAKTPTNNRPEVYMKTVGNLGVLLGQQGNPAEAEKMFREALELQKKHYGEDSPVVAHTLGNLAHSLDEQGKLTEAEPLYREQLAMRRKLLGNEHPSLAFPLNNLAVLLVQQGKLAEAETLHRDALAIRRKSLGNDHPFVALSLFNLARVLDARGKTDEAEADYREALSCRKKLLAGQTRHMPSDVINVLDVYLRLAANLVAAEKFVDAEALGRDWIVFAEKEAPDDWRTAAARSFLGASLLELKRFDEAEPLLLAGQAGLQQRGKDIPPDEQSHTQEAVQRLIRLYEATGRPDKAADWRKRLNSGE